MKEAPGNGAGFMSIEKEDAAQGAADLSTPEKPAYKVADIELAE
jgi:hypothetical protein